MFLQKGVKFRPIHFKSIFCTFSSPTVGSLCLTIITLSNHKGTLGSSDRAITLPKFSFYGKFLNIPPFTKPATETDLCDFLLHVVTCKPF